MEHVSIISFSTGNIYTYNYNSGLASIETLSFWDPIQRFNMMNSTLRLWSLTGQYLRASIHKEISKGPTQSESSSELPKIGTAHIFAFNTVRRISRP